MTDAGARLVRIPECLPSSQLEGAAWPGGPVVAGKEQLLVCCPTCGTRLTLGRIHFAGMPIFVECRCTGCSREYWLDWPAGHALLHPTLIDATSGTVYFDGLDWYARRLVRCLATRTSPVAAATQARQNKASSQRAILVNCVDFLYGHCLLKLLSGLSYARHHPDADLIVVAPKMLSWLIPSTAVSRVEVDLPLPRSDVWIEGLHEAVRDVVASYKEIEIAPAISQPPLDAEDITQLLGPEVAPQPFWTHSRSEEKPLATLIVREDRLWLGSHRPLVARLAGRLSPELRHRLLVRHQNRCFARVVGLVRQAHPHVQFAVVGLGNAGRLPAHVVDLRQTAGTITEDQERRWLATYARSRVVVGVHGSNMLLPSALAGAVVDLLPKERLRNITQDIIISGESDREPKLCLFRYRILPLSTGPEAVADIISSLLTDADRHYQNMIESRVAYTTIGWPRPVTWRRLTTT